jgi:hypothetical protein
VVGEARPTTASRDRDAVAAGAAPFSHPGQLGCTFWWIFREIPNILYDWRIVADSVNGRNSQTNSGKRDCRRISDHGRICLPPDLKSATSHFNRRKKQMSKESLRPELELEGCSVVALGSFNPAIFQPQWLAAKNLIRSSEADAAKIQIIHQQASIFSLDWLTLQVTPDRFSVETSDPTKILPLRDLVIGTFKILEHTPLTSYGFNCHRHYRMPSEPEWHAFGHFLAPKAIWKDILIEPGLRVLNMLGKRPDSDAVIGIQIEPSLKIRPGVFFQINEHHDIAPKKDDDEEIIVSSNTLIESLRSSWDGFIAYSRDSSDILFKIFDNPRK